MSPGRRQQAGSILVTLAASLLVGCTRVASGATEPPPTYIPQPTPDPTMAVVIQGGGLPVSYLPPLEIKGSPTPAPPARSGGGSTTRPAAKPTQPATNRDAPPARDPAPAPAPKPTAQRETAPAPRPAPPAPAATRPPSNPPSSGSGSSGSGGGPAIINPNTALPGGARPNPTPGR
ncbi:MAG: hypothetical protein IT306_04740 [Chloroflexi bacterium]|nr:hypothetical protein [Chloroflexota bacterium]